MFNVLNVQQTIRLESGSIAPILDSSANVTCTKLDPADFELDQPLHFVLARYSWQSLVGNHSCMWDYNTALFARSRTGFIGQCLYNMSMRA